MAWGSKGNHTEEQIAAAVRAGTANRRGSSNGGGTADVVRRHQESRQPENRAARGNGK